jgi:siroheme synthase-like protein
MPLYYPVFLDLRGRRVVVIGGGAMGEEKVTRLMPYEAQVVVVSPDVTDEVSKLAQDGQIEWIRRPYRPDDLEGAFIAIAATNRREVNQRIFEEAERLGVLLNVVDDPPRCSFIAPSVVQRGAVTLAISTGGASPALARKLRESLANSVELEWADLAAVMSQARRRIKEIGAPVDPQHWQCCLTPELLELVQAGREQEALEFLVGLLLDQHSNDRCPGIPRGLPAGVID